MSMGNALDSFVISMLLDSLTVTDSTCLYRINMSLPRLRSRANLVRARLRLELGQCVCRRA